MKRLALLVVAVLALACMASAAQDNWRVKVGADNGAGYSYAIGAQLGVYPTSVDGWDFQDGNPYNALAADVPGTALHVAAVVPGETDLYLKSIKAPTLTFPGKTWEFYVAGNINYAYDQIRLQLFTVTSTTLPTQTFDGIPISYAVQMLDNRGVAGAPANHTMWEIPFPTVHSSSVPFWTCPVALPAITLSEKSNAAFRAEGYKLQLVQEIVPEPSSILALGSGLLGLAGYAFRRRRS